MSQPPIGITRYNLVSQVGHPVSTSATWSDLIDTLWTHHREASSKEAVPGFGGHVLKDPETPCVHNGVIRPKAHRCDACVDAVTLFVFDVDEGTEDEVAESDRLLQEAGLAAHWYSSYSFSPTKPAFRLIVPPTRPVTPAEYPALRAHLIRRFDLKVADGKCTGASHFWWLPSCPPAPARLPVTETLEGVFFDPDSVPPAVLPVAAAPKPVRALGDWEPPEEPDPGTPIDLSALRSRLERLSSKLLRNPHKKQNGVYLQRMLVGEPLAEAGSRNQAAFVTTGTMAFAAPGTPLSVFMLMIRPSLDAMIRAGSKLTEDKIERMFLTAMQKKAASDASLAEFSNKHKTTAKAWRAAPDWKKEQ